MRSAVGATTPTTVYRPCDCAIGWKWRTGLTGDGVDVPRPAPTSETLNEREQRWRPCESDCSLTCLQASKRTPEQWSRWRLAYLLDWHRREAKAAWWEYYRLVDMMEEDLFDEPSAVAGLEFVEHVEFVLNKKTGKPTGSVIDRYRYPPQEMEIRRRDDVKLTDAKFGDVVQADRIERTLDVRKGKEVRGDASDSALCAQSCADRGPRGRDLSDGERVASGADATLVQRLLRGDLPMLRTLPFATRDTESAVEFAVRTQANSTIQCWLFKVRPALAKPSRALE